MYTYNFEGSIRERVRQQERDKAERLYRAQLDHLSGTLEVVSYMLGRAMSVLVEIKGMASEPDVKRLADRGVSEYWEGLRCGQELEIPEDLRQFADFRQFSGKFGNLG